MKAEEVPLTIKQRLPRFAGLVDEYLNELGDAVNYPLLGQVVGTLLAECRDRPNAKSTTAQLQVLFDLTEEALTAEDPRVNDLFYLEVIEPLGQPDVVGLGLHALLHPISQQQWRTFVNQNARN